MQSMSFFLGDSADGQVEPLMFDRKLVADVSDLHFNDHWEIIQYNFMLTNSDLWVETLRQWFTLAASIAIICLLAVSVHNLRRTQQGLDFDQLILVAELVKVSVDRFDAS